MPAPEPDRRYPPLPERPSIAKLRAPRAVAACDLHLKRTQTVFGEGHPSAILRAPDETARVQEMRRFVADLSVVGKALARSG